MTRILLVRMSALGDIVHALPVLAALRASRPEAEIDWLADRRYAGVLQFVAGLSRCIIGRPGLLKAVREMRPRRYDVAVDLQGLLKSAVMARLSGATRVIGFEKAALRERAAAWFYTDTAVVPANAHVIQKNLAVLDVLGVARPRTPTFPIIVPDSSVADTIERDTRAAGAPGFVLINPGAAWPNKRWLPERFGAVARAIHEQHQLVSYVLWGPAESALADAVVAASSGVARRAPNTSLGDLLALAARAALMVSGDTGPAHLAAAVGTPLVGLYGPTWPHRNGPWRPDDVVVSRASQCGCHHKRECRRVAAAMCIADIGVDEVLSAVAQRLHAAHEGR